MGKAAEPRILKGGRRYGERSMKRKKLTKREFLICLGLFTLAQQHYKKSREFEVALSKALGYDDSYMGHISDAILDELELEEALQKEGILLEKVKK